MSSVRVPIVGNCRVIGHVHRASKRAPVLFSSTLVSPGSIMGNCRVNTGGCVGGPFVPRRLSTRIRTLLGLSGNRGSGSVDRYCGVNGRCILSTARTALGRTSNMGGALAIHRANLLRVLYRGQKSIVHQRTVLSGF